MTRIAVIGNSHTGPLMWAWHTHLEQLRPDIDVTFFRGHTVALRAMSVEPEHRFGCLDRAQDDPELQVHTMKYNMRLSLDLRGYDAVIAVGWWNIAPEFIHDTLRHFSVDGIGAVSEKQRLSAPAFDAMLSAHVMANIPPPVWHHWQNPRLLHLSMPRRNAAVLATPAMRNIDHVALATVWQRASVMYAQQMADVGIETVVQPTDTLTPLGFTDEKFGRDPATATHRKTPDYAHMNTDYGLLLWRDVFGVLGV